MKIFCDLDGVLRDLHMAVMGFPASEQKEWFCSKDGVDYINIVHNNLDLLVSSPRTVYFDIIVEAHRNKTLNLLTCQPISWREKTSEWIVNNIDVSSDTTFVSNPKEKLKMLKDGDYIIEDYPLFEDYSKVILIDYPYNRNVKRPLFRVKSKGQLRRVLTQIGV